MSQISCESILLSFPELAMLHFRGKDLVVGGKVLVISLGTVEQSQLHGIERLSVGAFPFEGPTFPASVH